MSEELFSNNKIVIDNIPTFENANYTPLNKEYINVIIINLLLIFSFVFMGIVVLHFTSSLTLGIIFSFILFSIVFFVFLFFLYKKSFKRRGYLLREKDILYASGLLSYTTTIVPINRIQHVAIHQGIFSRMYHLSEIQIYTAGSNSSDLFIAGLSLEDAEKIKEYIVSEVSKSNLKVNPTLSTDATNLKDIDS